MQRKLVKRCRTQRRNKLFLLRAKEAKLKAKYPSLRQKPGGSDFLMHRFQKRQTYFDSRDYNTAKDKMKNKQSQVQDQTRTW